MFSYLFLYLCDNPVQKYSSNISWICRVALSIPSCHEIIRDSHPELWGWEEGLVLSFSRKTKSTNSDRFELNFFSISWRLTFLGQTQLNHSGVNAQWMALVIVVIAVDTHIHMWLTCGVQPHICWPYLFLWRQQMTRSSAVNTCICVRAGQYSKHHLRFVWPLQDHFKENLHQWVSGCLRLILKLLFSSVELLSCGGCYVCWRQQQRFFCLFVFCSTRQTSLSS